MFRRFVVREMMCSVLVGAGMVAVGCGSPMKVSKTDLGGVRYERDGLAVEYMAGIDRYTFVGDAAADAPNMVKKQKLRQDPAADGSYTFYGGVYTWVSPQGGELGWIDDQGSKLDWPPDPGRPGAPAG